MDRDTQSEETDTVLGEIVDQTDLISNPHRNIDAGKVYAYSYTNWPDRTILTLGMGFDRTDVPGRRQSEPTPKLGIEYRATDEVTLRAAAFRTVKSQARGTADLEPTIVAGFNQLFDDFNGTKADQVAGGLDFRATPDLAVGVEGLYRRISPPRLDEDDVLLRDAKEEAAQAYLYWTATDSISVSLEVRGSRFRQHESNPQAINTILAPLSVRYFDRRGFFAVAGVEYVSQSVTDRAGDGSDAENWADAWLVDAAIGYRLPGRYGILSLELNNLLNQEFHWQDDSFRSSEQQNRRFLPERSALVRLNFAF